MDIKRFQDLLGDYLEGRLPEVEARRFRSALEQNPALKREAERHREVIDLLKKKPSPKAPPHLKSNIMRQVRAEARAPNSQPEQEPVPVSSLPGSSAKWRRVAKRPPYRALAIAAGFALAFAFTMTVFSPFSLFQSAKQPGTVERSEETRVADVDDLPTLPGEKEPTPGSYTTKVFENQESSDEKRIAMADEGDSPLAFDERLRRSSPSAESEAPRSTPPAVGSATGSAIYEGGAGVTDEGVHEEEAAPALPARESTPEAKTAGSVELGAETPKPAEKETESSEPRIAQAKEKKSPVPAEKAEEETKAKAAKEPHETRVAQAAPSEDDSGSSERRLVKTEKGEVLPVAEPKGRWVPTQTGYEWVPNEKAPEEARPSEKRVATAEKPEDTKAQTDESNSYQVAERQEPEEKRVAMAESPPSAAAASRSRPPRPEPTGTPEDALQGSGGQSLPREERSLVFDNAPAAPSGAASGGTPERRIADAGPSPSGANSFYGSTPPEQMIRDITERLGKGRFDREGSSGSDKPARSNILTEAADRLRDIIRESVEKPGQSDEQKTRSKESASPRFFTESSAQPAKQPAEIKGEPALLINVYLNQDVDTRDNPLPAQGRQKEQGIENAWNNTSTPAGGPGALKASDLESYLKKKGIRVQRLQSSSEGRERRGGEPAQTFLCASARHDRSSVFAELRAMGIVHVPMFDDTRLNSTRSLARAKEIFAMQPRHRGIFFYQENVRPRVSSAFSREQSAEFVFQINVRRVTTSDE